MTDSKARAPQAQRQAYQKAYQKGSDNKALRLAEQLTYRFPDDPFSWRSLAAVLYRQDELMLAKEAAEKAQALDEETNPGNLRLSGKIYYALNQLAEAQEALESARELMPKDADTHLMLGHTYHAQGKKQQAIESLDRAHELDPKSANILAMRIMVLSKARYYASVMRDCEKLMALKPEKASYYNLVGTRYNDIGEFEKARYYYREAVKRDPEFFGAASNEITSMHYDPSASAEDIYQTIKDWQPRFVNEPENSPTVDNRLPGKKLRIGMLSTGFNLHPVGQMIQSGVLNLKKSNVEFIYYSLDRKSDIVTRQLMRTARHWKEVYSKKNAELEQILRDDQLDILIDMCGHNDGNKLPVIAHKPAPLIVKWVGGQINTMGLDAIDYFLSDKVETPNGVDEWYAEKLIRLPDDYICYTIPRYIPEEGPLPARENGYITLGCLNNPAKINTPLLECWSRIMHALPDSRLLLRSGQYEDESFCRRIRETMADNGIDSSRLMMEGQENHKAFLETYQRIDIALDPWPYSGGLTTCEALAMGVPVVTLPGPTFAGRHAATHLVNVGLPELVTDTWEAYQQRVIELASDIESLATIRQHLREQMQSSPLCDGKRFAENFDGAIRAIWQRFCAEKPAEALTFLAQGVCKFADEDKPVVLQHPAPYKAQEAGFSWQLMDKVITIDNSAKLIKKGGIHPLRRLNAFSIIAFDAASSVDNPKQFEGSDDIQLFQHANLGDGQQATLHACLDAAFSSTLEPLPPEQQYGSISQGAKVLTKLPINTIALDSIDGLESLDWLILDALSDAVVILENGVKALKDTLIIQVRIVFQPTHQRQPSLVEVQHWMSRHGFRFYRFNDQLHQSHLPESVPAENRQATELQSANAIFLPSHERMIELKDNQRTKLAFLLHTVYGIKDMAYTLLADVDEVKAEKYLFAERILKAKPEPTPEALAVENSEKSTSETQEFPLPDAPFMSPSERNLFKKSLQKTKHYFEFGSGGSTVWAVEEGLTVKGVESDAKWINALKDKLGEKCQVDAVDIGPTKEWGYPVSTQQASKFSTYSKAIHFHEEAFDLILVDGRFRVACTMAAIQHILERSKKPQNARIFIHDFWNRPHYHAVLPFLETVEKVESAGLFKIAKSANKAEVAALWEQYAKQPQ